METSILVARLCLAGLFALAAAAKLADRGRTRASLLEFGVPSRVAAPGAVALAAAELAVAALLVPAATARLGAFGGLALLLVFAAAVARVVRRGERPGCNCFGAVHARPVGWRTLVRNAVLGGIALGIALLGPGREIGAPAAPLAAGTVVAALFAAQAWFSMQLFRQNGRLLERVRALEGAGAELAPQFTLPDLDGERRSLDELLEPGRPVALVFTDPGCPACDSLPARLAQLRDERAGELEIVLVTRAGGDGRLERLRGAAAHVLVQEQHELAAAYAVHAVPSAVLIGPDGRMASALQAGSEAIDALLSRPARRQVPVAV